MPKDPWDIDNQDERWWENSLVFSIQYDFPDLEQPPEQVGVFWEALNIGV